MLVAVSDYCSYYTNCGDTHTNSQTHIRTRWTMATSQVGFFWKYLSVYHYTFNHNFPVTERCVVKKKPNYSLKVYHLNFHALLEGAHCELPKQNKTTSQSQTVASCRISQKEKNCKWSNTKYLMFVYFSYFCAFCTHTRALKC